MRSGVLRGSWYCAPCTCPQQEDGGREVHCQQKRQPCLRCSMHTQLPYLRMCSRAKEAIRPLPWPQHVANALQRTGLHRACCRRCTAVARSARTEGRQPASGVWVPDCNSRATAAISAAPLATFSRSKQTFAELRRSKFPRPAIFAKLYSPLTAARLRRPCNRSPVW